MKNVVDLFIAKDRTSIFWFTMACASILLSSIYVRKIIADVSTKPQYVIMDANNVFYFAPSVEFEGAVPMHLAQTRLAMQTIYNRNARNLEFEDRIGTIFYDEGIKQVRKEFGKDAAKFTEEERDQTVEVNSIRVIQTHPSGIAATEAKGTLTRHSTFKGQKKVEKFTVTAQFVWRINKRMGTNGLPPIVCTKMLLADPVKVEAEQ